MHIELQKQEMQNQVLRDAFGYTQQQVQQILEAAETIGKTNEINALLDAGDQRGLKMMFDQIAELVFPTKKGGE